MERRKQNGDFSPHPELTRYHMMPKHFVGPETADDLFSIYQTLEQEKPYPSYLYAAGSAAAESGIVGTQLSEEERHYRINCAQDAWRRAQNLYLEKHIHDDWSESKLTAFIDRVEAQVIYVPLFHDIVSGNVRPETLRLTHERLMKLAMRNFRLNCIATESADSGAYGARRGLAYELGGAGAVTRLKCPSFFAMLATARGDNGTYHKHNAHDLLLIEQSWGSIRSSTPIEIKPSGQYRKGRYDVAYVHGRFHLSMPSTESPLNLCTILVKEIEGIATPQEITELNMVTSKILTETLGQTKYDYFIKNSPELELESA